MEDIKPTEKKNFSRALLSRIPHYRKYLSSLSDKEGYISATVLANKLSLGEVQVRKDLAVISGEGRPRIGYEIKPLLLSIENALGKDRISEAVIVGAGKIGCALLEFDGFLDYGINIVAAFDTDSHKIGTFPSGKPIFGTDKIKEYCTEHNTRLAVIAVPTRSAQEVCDILVSSGIKAIWNFARIDLKVPKDIKVYREDLALSLAHLNSLIND